MPMARRKDPVKGSQKAENGTVEAPQPNKQQKQKNSSQGAKELNSFVNTDKLVQDDLTLRPLLADITKHPAIFSYDSSFFFCTFSKQVLMYSTTTGEMTHPFYHPSEVVGIVPHPSKKELFSFTETGEIYVWDFNDGRLIMTLSTNTQIASIAASRHLSKIYIVGQNGQIQSINLLQENLDPKNIGTPMINAKSVVSNESGRYVCVMTDVSLTLFDTSNGTSKVMKQLKPTTFTCLAIHPSLSIAAVGDSKGSIFLWYFSSESSELTNTPASNLHWHANPVRSLVFTDEGLHLLSGGSEGVLVQWSLEQNKKTFLPRLRSAIEHISMDQTGKFIAVSMRNNFIQLIDALSQSVVLKTLGISVENKSLNLMTIDPYSKLLVVNSSRGTLQFCDPTTGRPNFELDILSSVNAITGANGDLKLPVITSAGLSPNSTYIVTVVCVANEEVLQFWNYDPVTKTLSLNTQLGSPHGKGKVKGIVQHPSRDLVVTFGSDANFKFWLRDGESKDKQRKFWKCRSVTGYRDLIPNGGCFSQDGSVLAVAHEHTVTLWETSTLALRGTLCAWPSTEKVKHVGFIPDRPHLVCVTDGGLYVWDVVSYSIVWSYNGKISSLGIDNYDPIFAVVESGIGGLLLFDSSDPQPVFKVPHAILQDSSCRVLTTFVSRFGESSLAKPVVIIGLSDTVLVAEHEREPQAPVQMAQHARAYKAAPEPAKVVVPAKKSREQLPALHTGNMSLFDTPSHVIPPVSALFAPFMDSLVARKQTTASSVAQKSPKESAPAFKKPDAAVEKEKNNDELVDANYNSLGSIFKKRKTDTPGEAPSKKQRATPTSTPTATPTTTPAKAPKTPLIKDSTKSTPSTEDSASTPLPTPSKTVAAPTTEFKTPSAKTKTPKRTREETQETEEKEQEDTTKKPKTPAATPVKSTKTPQPKSTPAPAPSTTTPETATQSTKKPQPDTPHPKTRPTPPPPATPVQNLQKNAKNPDTPRPPAANGKVNEKTKVKETEKAKEVPLEEVVVEQAKKDTPAPKKTPAKQATKTPAKTPAAKTSASNDADAPAEEEVSVSQKSTKKAPSTPAASASTSTPTRKLFDEEGESAETPTKSVLKNPMSKENMEKEHDTTKTPKKGKTPAKSKTPAKPKTPAK